MFGAWVTNYCLAPEGFEESEGAVRLLEIARCREDIARATPPFVPGNSSTWLFCTCAQPLRQAIGERWFMAVVLSSIAIVVYLALLICILCGACRGAAKAKKRRRQNELELV